MVYESVVTAGGRLVDQNEQVAHPDRVADRACRRPAGYQEVAVAAFTAALTTLGLRSGDRVLVLMPSGPGFAEAIISTIRLGAVPLPMSPRVSARDLISDLMTAATETGARLVAASAECTSALAGLQTELELPVDGPQGRLATVLLLGPNQTAAPVG